MRDGVRFNRCLGPVHALQPKEWTDETASGRPALRCACGQIYDLPTTHDILISGVVVPAISCESCSFRAFVTLEAWKLEETEVLR